MFCLGALLFCHSLLSSCIRNRDFKNRKESFVTFYVLKLGWSVWVCARVCVCVCVVTSQAQEALSCHHTLQLPVFLQASLPAADLFELGMRESLGGLRQWNWDGEDGGVLLFNQKYYYFCNVTMENEIIPWLLRWKLFHVSVIVLHFLRYSMSNGLVRLAGIWIYGATSQSEEVHRIPKRTWKSPQPTCVFPASKCPTRGRYKRSEYSPLPAGAAFCQLKREQIWIFLNETVKEWLLSSNPLCTQRGFYTGLICMLGRDQVW